MNDAPHWRRLRHAIALVALLVVPEVRAAPPPIPTPDGEALFVFHCATCHGHTGHGDGPDAFLFTPSPRDLHDGFLERYETDKLVRRILDGAILLLPFDPAELRARANDTEALTAHLEAIPQRDPRLTVQGQRLYMTRCQSCHGVFGHDDAKNPAESGHRLPDLSSATFQRSRSDAELLSGVRHGRPGMRPIPMVREDDDVRALVAYVRALSPGFELYARYCEVCHGADGHPSRVVESARRPTMIFDRDYFARRDPERLRLAVWHMLDAEKPMMPHFRGGLSEGGARAIIEYLRSTK